MVERLAQRLKDQPQDAEGWAMLARSYSVLGRHPEALQAYEKALALRKDDANLKKIGDDTIKDLIKTGEMAKLYDKWFMQPIPPKNTRVGLAASDSVKAAWANPNDKPMEDYKK